MYYVRWWPDSSFGLSVHVAEDDFICEKEAEYIDVKCNTSKSMAILTGKISKYICETIVLFGAKLDYVSKSKYVDV